MTKGEQARLTCVAAEGPETGDGRAECRAGSAAGSGFRGSRSTNERRHAEQGDAGLCDRPRVPQRSAAGDSLAKWSARLSIFASTITSDPPDRWYLKRFHRMAIAVSSVHRILKRQALLR